MLRVLIGCEYSGRVRDAFRVKGCDAWSCDLLECEVPGPHIQGDVREVLDQAWDMFVFFPDCTYLCSSGLHWNKRRPERATRTEEAVAFVLDLLARSAHIPRVAFENPIGTLSTRYRKPDQIIQPYDFGEDASKATCLWLRGLPRLVPTERVAGRMVEHKGRVVERWSNQTDSGQNRLTPDENRWKERARTYAGIARAMAEQWSAT